MASPSSSKAYEKVCQDFDKYKDMAKFFLTFERVLGEMVRTPEQQAALEACEWSPTLINGQDFVGAFMETLKDCITNTSMVETIFNEQGIQDSGLLKQVSM